MDMEFKGLNGTIQAGENSISINRSGAIDVVFHKKGTIIIPYRDIKDVFFTPGSIINGYISIECESTAPSSILSAMKDEKTIIFRMFSNSKAERIVQFIKSHL